MSVVGAMVDGRRRGRELSLKAVSAFRPGRNELLLRLAMQATSSGSKSLFLSPSENFSLTSVSSGLEQCQATGSS